jgi:hypothetical protein
MKCITLLGHYLIYLLIPFSFVGCSEDPEPETVPEGKIVATIDGVYFEADAEATLYGNGEFRLSGKSGNADIWISMSETPVVVATYELKGGATGQPGEVWITYRPNGTLIFSSAAAEFQVVVGSVTFTEVDETNKTISGTFSSQVIHGDMVTEITSGAFNKIPYEVIPRSTLSVKIDGVDFEAPIVVSESGLGRISLVGKTLSESQTIQFSFNSDITAGAHNIGGWGDVIHAIYTVDNTSFVSASGTLTIKKHDTVAKTIEASFNFIGASVAEDGETHTLTSGLFFIKYY